MEVKRSDLGYLGLDFQYKLAHHFMNDKKFFRDMYDIIDNNMFTEPNLKKFVGTLQDYYKEYDYIPSYEQMEIELRSKSRNDQDLEYSIATIEKIKKTLEEAIVTGKQIGRAHV